MDTAFKKDTARLRDGNGLICIKAIQSIDTAGLRIGLRTKHTKPWTCEASRNHEVPWGYINAELSRVFLKKAVDFRA